MSWNDPINPCIAILFISSLFKKKLRFHLVCEAEPYFIFNLSSLIYLHTAYRFTGLCKVKVITVKVSVHIQHFSVIFVSLGAKV